MNQNFKLSTSSSMTTAKFLATAIATSSLMVYTASSVTAALEDSPKTLVDEVWQIVNNEYVGREFDRVDWLQERQELLGKEYVDSQAAYKSIRDSLESLGDPYTRFLNPEEFAELNSQTSGELSGIGIRLALDKDTSELTVIEPVTNSPADKAGIKTGDKIIAIDNKPTSLMSLEQASAEIRGEVGTEINLKISRAGEENFDLTLVREQVELPSVDYNLSEAGETKVGYIRLDDFSSHAAEQMEKAIEDLNNKQVTGFVLDLRGNPGGLLFSSVEIARMWLGEGAIVSTIDRKGGNQKFSANGKALTDLPLVILVDRYSASASEILAGALKENGRATVVGTQTYGKGTVQSVHSLSDGSGLAVTIARYYPPSGQDINYRGIAPDVEVDLTAEQKMSFSINPGLWGTEADPQYAKAIQILQENTFSRNAEQTANPLTVR